MEKTDEDQNEEQDQDLDKEVDEETQDETNEDDDEVLNDDQDADEDSEGDSEFKKRFTQFKGDTAAEYAKNLEEGYLKSSTEALRLKKLLDEKGEKTEKTDDKTPIDPDVAWAKGERQRQWTKEINDFKTEHPELDSDPALAQELNDELAIIAEVYQRKNGYGISMAEGLTKAWASLGYDANDKKERIAAAAKDGGARSKSGTAKTTPPKSKLSESQITVYMEMQQVDRNEAIKKLSAYTK